MKKILLFLLAAASSCSGLFAQSAADSLLRTLSTREKIAQLIIEAVHSQDSPELRTRQQEWIREGLGGLIVMDDTLAKSICLINQMQALAKIPMIVSIDGEWGASMRYHEYSAFPRAMQMGALPDESLVEEAGRAIGEELRELRIFVNYAPVVDVNNNPGNPVINTRSFGEDPDKVARFGAAYMRGMQSAGVYGSAKHFPGHGDTNVDSHKGLPILEFDRKRLDSLELMPFRHLVSEGVEMVMVGHLSIPALDSSGTPASISKPIVTDLLRNETGFEGIIITDALGMQGVAAENSNAAFLAYKAGADILLMPQDTGQTIDELEKAFKKGELSIEDLDARVLKVLRLKEKCGMLAENYSPFVDTSILASAIVRPHKDILIQKICDNSMTVVKGRFKKALRLGRRLFSSKPRTAYVAFNAVSPESACFEKELGRHGRTDRFDLPLTASPAQIDSVESLLKGYRNVIVVFHSGKPVTRSGGPRRFAHIETDQFERIAAWNGKHRLHGVYLGNPYDLDRLKAFKSFRNFIIAYSDTSFNNIAAARALTGNGSAQGRLPVGAGGLPAGYSSNIR